MTRQDMLMLILIDLQPALALCFGLLPLAFNLFLLLAELLTEHRREGCEVSQAEQNGQVNPLV